ncbi:MAG: sugar-binding protein, partial [Ginsengibacter sp.]
MKAKFLFSAAILLFIFSKSFPQNLADRVIAVRATTPIKLDGKLIDEAWSSTPALNDFMQVRPKAGNEPSEKTEIKFLYDDNYLYVGIKAFDKEPQKILSNNLLRDKYNNDDGISFIIDSYNDKSNAILF